MFAIHIRCYNDTGIPSEDEQQFVKETAEWYDGAFGGHTDKGVYFTFESGANAKAFADKINRQTKLGAEACDL